MLELTVTESISAQFSFLPKVTGKQNDNLQSTFHTEGGEGEGMTKTREGEGWIKITQFSFWEL